MSHVLALLTAEEDCFIHEQFFRFTTPSERRHHRARSAGYEKWGRSGNDVPIIPEAARTEFHKEEKSIHEAEFRFVGEVGAKS